MATFTNCDISMLFATKNIDEVFQDVMKLHKEANKKQKGTKKRNNGPSLPNTYVLSKFKGKYKLTYGDSTSIYHEDGTPTSKHEIKHVRGLFLNKVMGKVIVDGIEMKPIN